MMRSSSTKLRVSDREFILADFKSVYQAEDKQQALEHFEKLAQKWGKIYPRLITTWRVALPDLLRFMDLPMPIRSYVYTTNPLERVNKEIKRRLKSMEVFQTEASAEKYL